MPNLHKKNPIRSISGTSNRFSTTLRGHAALAPVGQPAPSRWTGGVTPQFRPEEMRICEKPNARPSVRSAGAITHSTREVPLAHQVLTEEEHQEPRNINHPFRHHAQGYGSTNEASRPNHPLQLSLSSLPPLRDECPPHTGAPDRDGSFHRGVAHGKAVSAPNLKNRETMPVRAETPHAESFVSMEPQRLRSEVFGRRPLRPPRRKAVVVGINYRNAGPIALKGCANDAHMFAMALVNLWGFLPRHICLLADELPDPLLRHPNDVQPGKESGRLPLRASILLALRWLIDDCQDGDMLVFYFAGHGLQVDNLSGWAGEGYDEALLPLDCGHGQGDVNALSVITVRQLLLSVREKVQLSIFLDCAGGQTMLDAAGTGSTWKYIRGVKQRGIWPFLTDPTDKVERASYSSKTWLEPRMVRKEAKPRFVPGAEVSNTSDLNDALPSNCGEPETRAHGFLIVAAPWSMTPIEAKLPSIGMRPVDDKGRISQTAIIPPNSPIVHGCFTWALIKAMNDAVILSSRQYGSDRAISYQALMALIHKHMASLKTKQGLAALDQVPEVTFYRSSGSSVNEFVFYPGGGKDSHFKYKDARERSSDSWQGIPPVTDYLNVWQAEICLNARTARQLGPIPISHSHSAVVSTSWTNDQRWQAPQAVPQGRPVSTYYSPSKKVADANSITTPSTISQTPGRIMASSDSPSYLTSAKRNLPFPI